MRKSSVGPVDRAAAAAGPLDLGDLLAAALGRLGERLGLQHAGVERRGAAVLPNGCPLMWKVLLVEPWTPGQAPVVSVNQPAPVFGGAWVSRPLPEARALAEQVAEPRHDALVGVFFPGEARRGPPPPPPPSLSDPARRWRP